MLRGPDISAGTAEWSHPQWWCGLTAGSVLSAERLARSPQLFEHFPYGLAIGDARGRILHLNHRARQVLLPAEPASRQEGWSCCELICDRLRTVLGTGCMSALALGTVEGLPELRVDIERDRLQTAAWVTASALDADGSFVLFHLRPGRTDDRRRRIRDDWRRGSTDGRATLQIRTLGRFQVEGADGPIVGDWLEQRAGQVLKYLICERHRVVANDQIAEALWPGAGTDDGRNRLRFHVHALRGKIEPGRPRRSAARFVVARRGGYVFETTGAWIDADEFEREARAGLAAVAHGDGDGAAPHLHRAADLYKGEFMSEDPYAEWALQERERLRDLAVRVLRAQAQYHLDNDQLDAAVAPARRLADLEPYDGEAQRLFIEISLRRGQRSEAVRRFDFYRGRIQRSFGVEPDFDLRELSRCCAISTK